MSRVTDAMPVVVDTSLLGKLAVPQGCISATAREDLSQRAAVYATRARGDGTRRAYRTAWSGFSRWCASIGREPLAGDPDTIAMFLVRRADDGCPGPAPCGGSAKVAHEQAWWLGQWVHENTQSAVLALP